MNWFESVVIDARSKAESRPNHRRSTEMNEEMGRIKDKKESLHSGRKPDITHVRLPAMVYIARACEYGSVKYERSNYLRRTPDLLADFHRFRSYLRAVMSHAAQILDTMEAHQAEDPNLDDESGIRSACYARDTDTDGKTPASGLPHACGMITSAMMAITQAVDAGLLPIDPGQPWTNNS